MRADYPTLVAFLQHTGSLANQLATATAEEQSVRESLAAQLDEMRMLEERMEKMEEDMLMAQAEALGLRRKMAGADLSVEAAAARASAMEKLSELMKGEIKELSKQLCHAREEAELLRSAAMVSGFRTICEGVALCSRERD